MGIRGGTRSCTATGCNVRAAEDDDGGAAGGVGPTGVTEVHIAASTLAIPWSAPLRSIWPRALV